MGYLAWLQRDHLRRRVRLFARVGLLPGRAGNFSALAAVLAVIVTVPLLLTWYDPRLLPSAAALLTLAIALAWWSHWPGRRLWRDFVASAVSLAVFWGSWSVLWLFLENPWYRVVFLLVLGGVSWWYLSEWRRARFSLQQGEFSTSSTALLVIGFLSAFALGSSAESLMVYLALPFWQVLLWCYLPLMLVFGACAHSSGWPLLRTWRYWLAGILLLLQVFVVVTWWPTSFYVIGFIIALAFVAVTLVIKQDAQMFVNRRGLIRDLSVLGLAGVLVLLGARWL